MSDRIVYDPPKPVPLTEAKKQQARHEREFQRLLARVRDRRRGVASDS